MPNLFSDAQRDASAAAARSRTLGPYETAYDVRRGYDRADAPPGADRGPAPRDVSAPAWIGRAGERR